MTILEATQIRFRRFHSLFSIATPRFSVPGGGRGSGSEDREHSRRMRRVIALGLLFICAAAPTHVLQAASGMVPPKPTGLTVCSFGSTYAQLKWNTNPPPGQTVVIMASVDGGPYRTINSSASFVTYCNVGLQPNRHYHLRVVAYNGSGQEKSSPSDPVSVTTDVLPPTNFRAVAVGSSDINLSWGKSPGAVGYTISRSLDNQVWTTLARLNGSVNKFRDTSASGPVPYYYHIIAIGPSSNNSEQATLARQWCIYPLDFAALNPRATFVSGTGVNIEWNDPSNDTYPFNVQESSDSGTVWNTLAHLQRGAAYYIWSPLEPLEAGGKYEFRVQILNGNGGSANSSVATISVPGINLKHLASLVLESIVAALLLGAIAAALYWLRAARERAPSVWSTRDQELALLGLRRTRKRWVAAIVLAICLIVAVTAASRRAIMGKISADFFHNIPLRPSVLRAAAVSPQQINLSWVDTAADETGFELQRRTAGNSAWYPVSHFPPSARSFSNTTLRPGTEYSYRITAVNANGLSGYITASATTPAQK